MAEILDEALDAADVDPAHLDDVVITGSAARFPLVTEAIGAVLGRSVAAAPLPATAHGTAMLCRWAPGPAALPAAHRAESTANSDVRAQHDNGTPEPAAPPATARHRATPHRRTRFVAAALTVGTTTVGSVAASTVAPAPSSPVDAATGHHEPVSVATPNAPVAVRVPTAIGSGAQSVQEIASLHPLTGTARPQRQAPITPGGRSNARPGR